MNASQGFGGSGQGLSCFWRIGSRPLTNSVKVSPAKGERPKVLVDGLQQLLGAREAQRDVSDVKVLHVMRALEVLADISLPRGSECLITGCVRGWVN